MSKIGCQDIFQINTDILQANISGFILFIQIFLKIFLPGPFSNHNNSMPPLLEPLFKARQQSLGTVKIKINFGYQYKINVLLRQNGCCSNETGITPHELDEADTIRITQGLVVSTLDCI